MKKLFVFRIDIIFLIHQTPVLKDQDLKLLKLRYKINDNSMMAWLYNKAGIQSHRESVTGYNSAVYE